MTQPTTHRPAMPPVGQGEVLELRQEHTALRDTLTVLEVATEGSRELDWRIAEVLGEVPHHSIRSIGFDYDWYRKEGEWALWKATDSEGRSIELWQPKQRTTNLDAALTLIPNGFILGSLAEWDHDALRERGKWTAWVKELHEPDLMFPAFRANHAPTPALAVCRAAFKARAALTTPPASPGAERRE